MEFSFLSVSGRALQMGHRQQLVLSRSEMHLSLYRGHGHAAKLKPEIQKVAFSRAHVKITVTCLLAF